MGGAPPYRLADLLEADVRALERLFAEAPLGPEPTAGVFRGTVLRWLLPPRGAGLLWMALDVSLFVLPPFGVDFGRSCWYFWTPRLRTGRFEARRGPSRWRDAEVLALRYGASRLPAPVRGALYDEIKPLGPDLCLGIGGIDAPAGAGEHFFFALSRR